MPSPAEMLEASKLQLLNGAATDPSAAPAPVDDSQAQLAGWKTGPSLVDAQKARYESTRGASGVSRGTNPNSPMAGHVQQQKQLHTAAQQMAAAPQQDVGYNVSRNPGGAKVITPQVVPPPPEMPNSPSHIAAPEPGYAGYSQVASTQPAAQLDPHREAWQNTGDDSRNVQVIRGGRESYWNSKTGNETATPGGLANAAAGGQPLRPDQANVLHMMQQAGVPVQHQLDTYSHFMEQNHAETAKKPSWSSQNQEGLHRLGDVEKQIKEDAPPKNPSPMDKPDPDRASRYAGEVAEQGELRKQLYPTGEETAPEGSAFATAGVKSQTPQKGQFTPGQLLYSESQKKHFKVDENGVPQEVQ